MSRSGASRRANSNNNNNNRNGNRNGNSGPNIPLLPSAVNNRATMPQGAKPFRFQGTETVVVKNISSSEPGEVLLDQLISPMMTLRLRLLSRAFQRILWHKCELLIIPLNGSTTNSGYTAGVVEDPEAFVPTSGKNLIQYLTALRGTVVRQAWVQDHTGFQVPVANRPEMFTQQGSDVRRYSPGRFVIAAGGNITNATFQILLKYDVSLMVPITTIDADNETPVMRADGNNNSTYSRNSVNFPQTSGNLTNLGQTISLATDMLVTTATGEVTASDGAGSALAIIRAGTVGHFISLQVGNNLTLVWRGDDQEQGLTYYPVRWLLRGGGQAWVINRCYPLTQNTDVANIWSGQGV